MAVLAVVLARLLPRTPPRVWAYEDPRELAWRSRAAPDTANYAVTRDGKLVGSIANFVVDGETEITYWIDRSVWGQGIASQALDLLLETIAVRPIRARAASDNLASLRVLQKAGFTVVGTAVGYASARHAEIEETILRLA